MNSTLNLNLSRFESLLYEYEGDLKRGCLYRWVSLQYGESPSSRADLVSLHVVCESPRGGFTYERSFGALQREKGYRTFHFSAGNVRISGGRRKGAVVRPFDLRDGESARPAGTYKFVESGLGAEYLQEGNHLDERMMEEAVDAIPPVIPESAGIRVPPLYMTFRPDEAHRVGFKITADTMSELTGVEGYDPDLPITVNAEALKSRYELELDGRVGYPFRLYDGRGVLAFLMGDTDHLWRFAAERKTSNEEVTI